MIKRLTLPSPAKINLLLLINGRRADGYHLIQTVFTFIDLHDTLTFEKTENDSVQLFGDLLGIAQENNLIHKAALKLKSYATKKSGVRITVEKRIPDGAGLGGGSSNAATTLVALNHLWECNLSLANLMEIALTLGADVPIFLLGHRSFAEGIGEILTPIDGPEENYLLVFPQQKVPTAEIYADPRLTRDSPAIRIGDLLETAPKNDFEPAVKARYSKVKEAFDELARFSNARLSGSGSAIFVPFDSIENAKIAAKEVSSDLNPILCQGHNVSTMREAAISAGIVFPEWGVAKW